MKDEMYAKVGFVWHMFDILWWYFEFLYNICQIFIKSRVNSGLKDFDQIDRRRSSLNCILISSEWKNNFSRTSLKFFARHTQFLCVSSKNFKNTFQNRCFFWVFSFISNDINPWLVKNGCVCKRAKITFSGIRELHAFHRVIHHLD